MSFPRLSPQNKRRAVTKHRASLRRTREGNTRYRAPRWKIPNVTPIGSDEPVSKTLPRAVKRIAETLHPEKIILFGSYAYGNPTPDSDVDLLVRMENQDSHRIAKIIWRFPIASSHVHSLLTLYCEHRNRCAWH